MKLKVINKSGHPLEFAHKGDSGIDLCAWFGEDPKNLKIEIEGYSVIPLTSDYRDNWQVEIASNVRAKIPTGVFIEIPEGYEIQIRPKSGKSFKKGLNVILGTIDSNYRGEIMVIVHNIRDEYFAITEGEPIAQMVLVPVNNTWECEYVETLDATNRGEDGFGSTEKK